MTRVMLLAVLDVLLPGDENEPPLPSASEAALADSDGFLMASATDRVARLRAVEGLRRTPSRRCWPKPWRPIMRRRQFWLLSAGAPRRRSPTAMRSRPMTTRPCAIWKK